MTHYIIINPHGQAVRQRDSRKLMLVTGEERAAALRRFIDDSPFSKRSYRLVKLR